MKDKKKEPTNETQESEVQAEQMETAELDSQIDELQKVIDTLTQQKDEMVQLAQRVQADFENFRRRSRENEAKLSDTVKAGTMKEFLPIVDNFEMALAQIKRSSAPATFIQGVELLLKQFVKFLNDSGVTEIEAVGKPFDPHFHEAVMQISSDEWEDDTVSMVLKKGYMYKDMVLRPSSVQVSHKP